MEKKSVKKIIEEALSRNYEEIDLQDKGVTNLLEVPHLLQMKGLTSLVLSHNRLVTLPDSISNMVNLENLNLFNNELEALPITVCNLPKLRFLNCGLNYIKELPKGFGACPKLEVLDLTYNNLTATSFSANFFYLAPLRALYLGDNEFETFPAEVKNLINLQVLVIRDNDLINVPKELGELTKLKELHIQNNRLQVLPPELGNLDLISPKHMLRADKNPWIQEIADQLVLGTSHVMEYLKKKEYINLYETFVGAHKEPPPKKEREKTLKRKNKDLKKK